jgi:cellulose synthase/poly-beta-1,6-N-acetylglucosamine synthase-like glycosyltransferase
MLLRQYRDTSTDDGRPRTLTQSHEQVVTSRRVDGRFFREARPVKGATYFPQHPAASTAVVICLYNEDGPELSRTIESLASSPCCLDVVVVADGLAKLSASMQEYLRLTFMLADAALLTDGPPWGPADQVFVSNPVERGTHGSRFAVLLKRCNHKKINSHEWFFRAHAPDSGCKYALTTDTGAVFRAGSIQKMVAFLEARDVCAVTGRQRVMTERNQRMVGRAEPERDDWFEGCMRLLQGFDFEIDHTGGKAASCAAGLLPCLHGPCAMFRLDAIRGQCLDEYFDEWGYAAPHTLKLVGANLQLAEDRIPSLLGVFYSGKCNGSAFVRPACFSPACRRAV